MRQYRALSRGQGAFFVAQSAAYTTNMSGFDLRQAQPVMRACGWLFYEPRELDECQLAHEYIIATRNIHFWMAIEPACRLGLRRATR
jgi:hypothetical protein